MIPCPRCGKENEPGTTNCVRCGTAFAEMGKFVGQPQEAPETMCHWHPKVPTALACGKCGRYICPKCVVLSPAGTRCKVCSKQEFVFRPGAIWLDVKRILMSIFWAGRGSYLSWILLLSLVSFVIRSCQAASYQRIPQQTEIERGTPEDE